MAKDPAFLFYSSDFLNGVADLTMEERGQYITLLCLQHQKDALSDKTIRLSVGSVSVDVMAKFLKNAEGNFFNKRLVEEIVKRSAFTESRRKNGSSGGRPKASAKPNGKPYAKPIGLIMDNHMEDINVNEDVIDNIVKNEKKKPQPKKILFRESEYFDKIKLSTALWGTQYETANIDYYHETILNWSDSKGEKRLDWLATARTFMGGDMKEGKFVDQNFKTSINGKQQGNLRSEVQAEFNKRFGSGE